MLYHCFPRRQFAQIESNERLSEWEIAKGIKILKSILRFGLLLIPEENVHSGLACPRCCFTEGSFNALAEKMVPFGHRSRNHFQIFGPIAIGIENIDGRRLGLNPCNYFCSSALGSASQPLSEHILNVLRDARNACVALAQIESKANPDHEFPRTGYALTASDFNRAKVVFYGEKVANVKRIESAIAALPVATASLIEQLLGTIDHYPFWYLAQQLTLLVNMFQDVDSQSAERKRFLAHYSQREWRMLQCFHKDFVFLPLDCDSKSRYTVDEAAQRIAQLFQEFWQGDYRADGWLLFQASSRHVRTYIKEICVPRLYASDVENELDELTGINAFPQGRPQVKHYSLEEVYDD